MADSINSYDIGSNATLATGTRDQSGDGAPIVAAPGVGKKVRVREMYFWLTTLAESNDVTIKLGDLTLPPIPLGSGALAFSMYRALGEHFLCNDNGAVYLGLSGTDEIGVLCLYDVV